MHISSYECIILVSWMASNENYLKHSSEAITHWSDFVNFQFNLTYIRRSSEGQIIFKIPSERVYSLLSPL